MAFYVDPDGLYGYSALLGQYAKDAEYLQRYLTNGDLGAWQLAVHVPNSYAANLVGTLHAYLLVRADARLGHMRRVANGSAEGLNSAGHFYVYTDRESAEKLEQYYPDTVNHYGVPDGSAKDPHVVFNVDEDAVVDLVTEAERKDADDDLGIDLNFVQKELDFWSNLLSPSHWVRKILKAGYGIDPVEEVMEFYFGNWEAWRDAAKAWRRCGTAVHHMWAFQAREYTHLADYWRGRAQGAAEDHFATFAAATEAEIDYYKSYLFDGYRSIAEHLFEVHQIVSQCINIILDLAIPLGWAGLTRLFIKGGEALELIEHALNLIAQTLGLAKEGLEERARPLFKEEPPCRMESIVVYDHPEKKW
ncbi:hypothetical protein ABN034_07045 [Actinopolymorpha sp. B11F2]|uniref:hypothetical protein n=1 Tax=Actinopolymorpha sp. B11F2 TaxID=3160862 RepID=UPI0032E4053D